MTSALATTAPDGLLAMEFADQTNWRNVDDFSSEGLVPETIAAMSHIDSYTNAVLGRLPNNVLISFGINRTALQDVSDVIERQTRMVSIFSGRRLPASVMFVGRRVEGRFFPGSPDHDLRSTHTGTNEQHVDQPRGIAEHHSAAQRHSEVRQTTAVVRLLNVIERWKGLLAPHLYDAMRAHIERLLGDEEELAEEHVVPSASSLDDLAAFLCSQPWVRAPAVGMNRQGQFAVSWSPDRRSKADVTLTFLGGGTVRWYIYDGRRSNRPAKTGAGTMARQELPNIFAVYNCDKWMRS